MTAQLEKSGIDYEIVTAIDGRDLDLNNPRTAAALAPPYRESSWFQPTRAGCALSHLIVYQKILAEGLENALVLEDDVTIPADLAVLLDSLGEHLCGAEVTLLNFDSVDTCMVSRAGSVHLPAARQLVLPADVSQLMSGAAYVITQEACKRMDESRLPIRAKTDDWGFFCHEGVLDRVRCIVPLAVTKTPSFASTIAYDSTGNFKGRLLAMIAFYHLRPLQLAIAYRRKRIWRKYNRVEFVGEPFAEKPTEMLRFRLGCPISPSCERSPAGTTDRELGCAGHSRSLWIPDHPRAAATLVHLLQLRTFLHGVCWRPVSLVRVGEDLPLRDKAYQRILDQIFILPYVVEDLRAEYEVAAVLPLQQIPNRRHLRDQAVLGHVDHVV